MLLEAIISPKCCIILPGAVNTVNLGKACACVCVCGSGVNRSPLSLLFSHPPSFPLLSPTCPSFLLSHTLPPYIPCPLLGFFFKGIKPLFLWILNSIGGSGS